MQLSIKNFHSCQMPNGLSWNATMCFDGREFGSASQSGDGSANRYYFNTPQDRALFYKEIGEDEFTQMDAIESAMREK